jgi:exodeoxyribonuclease V alpha subunit
MSTSLQGQIERITYFNEENGFTIARVKVYGEHDLITITGNLISPTPGEILAMEGEWVHHPKYGRQFKVHFSQTKVPATSYGIEKYLGSGLVKGIGPVMAKRIVKEFGDETFSIIDDDITKLTRVEGIGEKRIDMIKKAWDDQKEIREVMIFLQSHGVSSGYATKIFKQYGKQSIQKVKENPYALAMDIFGIGFVTADKIAEKLGFDKSSELRVEAGILYVLQHLSEEGHVYYPYEPLIEKCKQMLSVERDVIVKAFGTISMNKKIIIEDLNEDLEEFKENNKAVYLAKLHFCETQIARRMKHLLHNKKPVRHPEPGKTIDWVQKQLSLEFAAKQKQAVCAALEHNVLVITGGPGTGKTTIINAIIKILSQLHSIILLAAPTGRAAKRMSETTGCEAKTIHRLLEFNFKQGGFTRNEENPLICDVLIIDEASMIDTVLMHHLLKAVPASTLLILVGDVFQLPSVGPGAILYDIIESGVVPVVILDEIFRQATESQIIINAHKINRGIVPQLSSMPEKTDFYFIRQEDPSRVLDIIITLVKQRIPVRFGFDPVNDIQVLTPMNKGTAGAANLNIELQKALNPGKDGLIRGHMNFKVNDKVMQIRNNYDKDVYNGDIGKIIVIDRENREVTISFYGRNVVYDFSDLDEIVLSYAVSVHKSQGSEYPAVVIPVLTQHYILLQRNLIYTAVTRGKKLVVLVGTKKALAIAVKNDKTQKRYTYLRYRLKEES